MKHFFSVFFALCLLIPPAAGQTIKAISYNNTNNVVVPPTVGTGFDFGALGIRANTSEFGTASGAVVFTTNGKITFYTTNSGFAFSAGASAAQLRNDLQVGQSNSVTFAQLYVRSTNVGAFEVLANLLASNNTTVSNETLFRVGVAEATNRSAQFGFRATNTNGSGVAVFSVFGFNALMQIGADASTNAVIYSGGGTNNEVMTLIRDGATEFARPLRFSTNAASKPSTNAPANTTNVAAWVEMQIGTNSYRVPLYQ